MIISIVLSYSLFAQNTPLLNDSVLIHKEDLKKKVGWMKLKVDSNFKENINDTLTKYEYYVFVNIKGVWQFQFPEKIFTKVIYQKTNPLEQSKLLNGIVDFYDKENHLIYKYIFKDGFYINIYHYSFRYFFNKYNGHLRSIFEYIPGENSFEYNMNSYNTKGHYNGYAHCFVDGSTYNIGGTYLPGYKYIPLMSPEISEGWYSGEVKTHKYEMYIDNIAHDGKKAASIKSLYKKINGFGTLTQKCMADKYLGKRIKMKGYVRAENVTRWAGLWLRVDQAGSNDYLSFDNMEKGVIRGNIGWNQYEIVLDVPENATIINFGALLVGTGQIWFDDITFEIVDDSVKTTGLSNKSFPDIIKSEPINLNFEK